MRLHIPKWVRLFRRHPSPFSNFETCATSAQICTITAPPKWVRLFSEKRDHPPNGFVYSGIPVNPCPSVALFIYSKLVQPVHKSAQPPRLQNRFVYSRRNATTRQMGSFIPASVCIRVHPWPYFYSKLVQPVHKSAQ